MHHSKMNIKHYLSAIITAAILSISFLSCDPKEDDPTTNPTTSNDVVKEIYGYYGKPAAQVLSILDAKGWIKSMETSGELTGYSYISSDSAKGYGIIILNGKVKETQYMEVESTDFYKSKLAENADKFLSLFEKWEISLNSIMPSESQYWGAIHADSLQFNQEYQSRDAFISDFQAKKSTITFAGSAFTYGQFFGETFIHVDYNTKQSVVSVFFTDEPDISKANKIFKNLSILKH
ncbi:MAG: hypothetical protein H6Q16_1151 [Bacteroidetes bacterium]|nr:hypothetical protein [Bacteroidota bacterium]